MAYQALPTVSDVARPSEDTGTAIVPTATVVDDEARPAWTDNDAQDLADAEEILAQLYRRLAGYLQASNFMWDGFTDDVSTVTEAVLEVAEHQITEIETLRRRKNASVQEIPG